MSRQQQNVTSALYQLRKMTGLSQPKFAELVGLSGGTIYFIESDRHTLNASTLSKIRVATGATLDSRTGQWFVGKFVPESVGHAREPYTPEHFKRFRALFTGPVSKEKDIKWMRMLFEKLAREVPEDRWAQFLQTYSGFLESGGSTLTPTKSRNGFRRI